MALFGQIPLPQNKNMFEGLMDQWMKQKQMAQTGKYQNAQIAFQKKAQERADAELPYLLQHHKDVHGKDASDAEIATYKNQILRNYLMQHGLIPGEQKEMPENAQMPQDSPIAPPEGMNAPNAPNVSQPGSPLQFGESDEQGTHPINAPNSPYKKLEQQGLITPQQGQQKFGHKMNGEVDPVAASLIKNMTGIDMLAQTPEQKVEMEAKKQLDVAEGKQNQKTVATIKGSEREVEGIRSLVKRAREIMDRRKDLTGVIPGTMVKYNQSRDKDLNALHTIFGEIQGKVGKLYNPRGGIGTISWAKAIKPSVFKKHEANEGMLEAIENNTNDLSKQYKEEIDELSGNKGESKPSNVKWKTQNGKLIRAE